MAGFRFIDSNIEEDVEIVIMDSHVDVTLGILSDGTLAIATDTEEQQEGVGIFLQRFIQDLEQTGSGRIRMLLNVDRGETHLHGDPR